MRKHDVRKWLHAVLDLLPVILIPVFMIYSHRHTIDSGSIVVSQNQVIDFNQRVNNGNFSNGITGFNAYDTDYSTLQYSNGGLLDIINSSGSYSYQYALTTSVSQTRGHTYIVKVSYVSSDYSRLRLDSFGSFYSFSGNSFRFVSDSDAQRLFLGPFSDTNTYAVGSSILFKSIQLFDLTQMFGSGNEPTVEQFNQWFSNDYYDYNLSHKELLKDTSTITFDDTDIMSQVVYQLYNSVDKYFNMGNVFNMTGVYDWFNLNIFNGNAPISIYIVWNIVLYEFVMDLLFLLYGLFMWFIDMVEKLMDKPLKSVK